MTALPTIASQPSPWRARKRSLFLSGAVIAAIAVAAPPREANAQSLAFQGTPTVDFGAANIDSSVSDQDLITVSTPTAVITWAPLDSSGTGTIDFLPLGATATFQNDPANPDFFVLNRIVPTDASRPIAFNGDVISRLRDGAGVDIGPGGSVAFYSPGGIIISSTATFDVGNLLLTTLDPVLDGNGNFVGPSGELSLVGTPDSTSAIVIEPGSSIDASAEGSYVALVAPRIDQGGDIRVNGSVGYVAGEAVDLFIDDGLFDIMIPTGTSVSTPISHTGSTGGPASSDIGDNHNIYMVAVPKNQAITMLLSGSVGFDPATDVTIENGAIVLSAGHDVFSGFIESEPASSTPANLSIIGGSFTSRVTGRAATDMIATSTTGNLSFAGDVELSGGARAHLGALAGNSVAVGGAANILADQDLRLAEGTAADAIAGEALIFANAGSTLSITGDALVSAVGRAGLDFSTDTAGSGTGGSASVRADGGALTIGGALTLDSSGFGGEFDGLPSTSGAGTGGMAHLSAINGGTVTVEGFADISAYGEGSFALTGTAAAGTGGTASITVGDSGAPSAPGGSVTFNSGVALSAIGRGGGIVDDSGTGGAGIGGSASISVANGQANFASDVIIEAQGIGGTGPDGGAGIGGAARVFATANGSANFTGPLSVAADGTGSDGFGSAGIGGNGTGGAASIRVENGADITFDSAVVQSGGLGGEGFQGGNGTGGSGGLQNPAFGDPGAYVEAQNGGTLTGNLLDLSATATGGNSTGASGGNALGGFAQLAALSGTDGSLVDIDSVRIKSQAFGGDGGMDASGNGLAGGFAQAWVANAFAQAANGVLVVNDGLVDASAFGGRGGTGLDGQTGTGGDGGLGGNAIGGSFNVGTGSGPAPATTITGSASFGQLEISADGVGGDGGGAGPGPSGFGIGGNGGFGVGGSGALIARGSALTATDVSLSAGGYGGAGGTGAAQGAGGAGAGGDLAILITPHATTGAAATADIGALGISTSGIGGPGSSSGAGEYGSFAIEVRGSSATIDSFFTNNGGTAPRGTYLDPAGAALTQPAAASTITLDNGTLAFTNPVLLSTPGDVDIAATGSGTMTAPTLDIDAVNITLSHTAPTGGAATISAQDVGLIASGSFQANASTLIEATNGVVIDSMTDALFGNISAGNAISLSTPGTAAFGGAIRAPAILITSGDIDIQPTALIGIAGVSNVELSTSVGAAPAVIGGDRQGPGYTLTRAEVGRIRGRNILFSAQATGTDPLRPPDVLLRDLTLMGSLDPTGASFIGLLTNGKVRVEGSVDFVNAGAADIFSVTADERVEVITPTGSIKMTDGLGNLAGSLQFGSRNIVVSDATLAGQLLTDPNFTGRTAALTTNSGPVNLVGYVQAGGIVFGAEDTLFVQNTGTSSDFGGLTVGNGGLVLASSGTGLTSEVAFGRRNNGNGTFTTGDAFVTEVQFVTGSGSPGFTADSEFNTVNLAQGVLRPPLPSPEELQPIAGPEVIVGPIAGDPVPSREDDGDPGASFGSGFVALVNSGALADDPLIEESAASGAESSAWAECESGENEAANGSDQC